MNIEICVLGGGPAGATLARRLAGLGHRVGLVERAAESGHRVGESLAPGIVPLFDALGIRSKIEDAAFSRPSRGLVRWAGDEITIVEREGGFHIDRDRFDALLLAEARAAGVVVLQPATAGRPVRDAKTARLSVPVRQGASSTLIEADYVCDARGRRSRPAASSVPVAGVHTIALCGWLRDVRLGGLEARVEAGDAEWYWGAPLPGGLFSAMVFVDAERCRGLGGPAGWERLYRAALARSTLLHRCLGGTLTGRVTARDATPYAAADPIGPDYLRVGEACFGIDPLSSQGVQAAMTQALQASIVVHTMRADPAHAPLAMQLYRERQAETVARHRRFAALQYGEHAAVDAGPFWQRRAGEALAGDRAREGDREPPGRPAVSDADRALTPSSRLRRSPAATVIAVPGIRGDLVVPTVAVSHPQLERAVAFVDGVEIVPLLHLVQDGATARETVTRMAVLLPVPQALAILDWMVRHGVIEVAPTSLESAKHL